MNLNGHISCTDVSSTGALDSGFFENKVSRYEHSSLNAVAFGQVVRDGTINFTGSFNVESVVQEDTSTFLVTIGTNEATPFVVVATAANFFDAPLSIVIQVLTNQTPNTFRLFFTNSALQAVTPVGFSFVVFRGIA